MLEKNAQRSNSEGDEIVQNIFPPRITMLKQNERTFAATWKKRIYFPRGEIYFEQFRPLPNSTAAHFFFNIVMRGGGNIF